MQKEEERVREGVNPNGNKIEDWGSVRVVFGGLK